VVGVHDAVTHLEVDALRLDEVEVQDLFGVDGFRDGRLLRFGTSSLQVAVHEVDLLQAAQALADVLGADLSDALDRLELRVGRGEDAVQTAELADDLSDDELRQPRDAAEDAVAARRDGIVERVELAVEPEDLGEAAEVEQVLVGQPAELLERGGERRPRRRPRGGRARAPACRRRRRPSSPRAASRSGAPRCPARRCSARSRRPCG
jgi:hypothetical protein